MRLRRPSWLVIVALTALPFHLSYAQSAAVQAADDQYQVVEMLRAFGQARNAIDSLEAVDDCPYELTEGWDGNVAHLNPGGTVKADTVLFVTHASRRWDSDGVIADRINERIAEIRKQGVRMVYLVDRDDPSALSRYYLKYRPDALYLSSGGEHELKVKARTLIFVGGNFSWCSAETVRDAILSAEPGAEPIHLVFLTDSLYQYVGGSQDSYGNWYGGHMEPEKKLLQNLSRERLLDYLKEWYFPDGTIGINKRKDRAVSLADYSFEIRRDGELVGTLGNGTKRVVMDLVVGPSDEHGPPDAGR